MNIYLHNEEGVTQLAKDSALIAQQAALMVQSMDLKEDESKIKALSMYVNKSMDGLFAHHKELVAFYKLGLEAATRVELERILSEREVAFHNAKLVDEDKGSKGAKGLKTVITLAAWAIIATTIGTTTGAPIPPPA